MKLHIQNPEVYGGCVYYSQNREDLILKSFFPAVKKGFYVDVGAFDPDEDSVTKLFYKEGWNGINIEPQTGQYKKFLKSRKRDINLNIGISSKKGQLKLKIFNSGGLSTFSESIKSKYLHAPNIDNKEVKETTVNIETLEHVFDKYAQQTINFMKIDVEGFEYQVLEGNNWDKYRPQVLCIEANYIESDWHKIISKNGYTLVFNDGLNEYFTDNRTNIKDNFDYVKYVVQDRGGGLRNDQFELMNKLYINLKQKDNHVKELVNELQTSIGNQNSIGWLIERIIVLLRNKVRGK